MNTEALMLILSTFLGIGQVLLAAVGPTQKYGIKWNLSSRDKKVEPLTGAPARLIRASENFKETFPFFAAAVLLVLVLNQSSWLSVVGTQMYFYARLVYVPIYAFDITVVRTLVWTVSMVGILMTLGALF